MASALDPFVGTWDLDPSTLDYQHGQPGRRAVYLIKALPDGGLTFDLEADDPDGDPMRVSYGGPLTVPTNRWRTMPPSARSR